jgi:hypothetical protein
MICMEELQAYKVMRLITWQNCEFSKNPPKVLLKGQFWNNILILISYKNTVKTS